MSKNSEKLTKIIGVPFTRTADPGDGTLLVTGKFTSDNKDILGDVITREATENAIPIYRQWGNIRYMHQPQPVGKVYRIGADDGLEWNEVIIRVIDPKAKFEVEKGLLTALSVGIVFGFDDFEMDADGGWIINNYKLAEISLVDHPANYDAALNLSLMRNLGEFRDVGRTKGIHEALKIADMKKKVDEEVQKSPECRQEGESEDDCVSRKIPEILAEDPDMEQEQAVAIAISMCSEACSEESLDQTNEEDIEMPEEIETQETVLPEEVETEVSAELDLEAEIPVEESVEEEEQELETELSMEEETPESEEEEIEVELNIEASEEIVEDEPETIDPVLGRILSTLEALGKAVEGLSERVNTAEAPLEEQTVDAEDETEPEENPLVRILERMEALEQKFEALSQPQNRTSPVHGFDETLEEELDAEVVEEDAPKPTTLKEGLAAYFLSRGQNIKID